MYIKNKREREFLFYDDDRNVNIRTLLKMSKIIVLFNKQIIDCRIKEKIIGLKYSYVYMVT